jgi:hypothetical protein
MFVSSLVSEAELESRVGSKSEYTRPKSERPHLIAVHGRSFYVNDSDYWRSISAVYVLALGGLIIWIGCGVETGKW